MLQKTKLIVLTILIFFPSIAIAVEDTKESAEKQEEILNLEEVVVTAPRMREPLTVVTDPKSPRQPIPAHDGSEYLKSIPGFSNVRKGGTDGDPVFRGMGGSRVGILLDGQQIFGGCGGRMDPPTAYVFPESYNRITVRKGPQNVTLGPGYSAGIVLFERDIKRFAEPDIKVNSSLTVGYFGRNDQMLDVYGGMPDFYIQAGGTRTDSDDYKDGDGNKVHSFCTRWSQNAAVGWTPNDSTLLELSAIHSDGEAAYADRGMDGSLFERKNYALKFKKENISTLFQSVKAQAYYNFIDHMMDNYTLRDQKMANMFMAMNPSRMTLGGSLSGTMSLGEMTQLILGLDVKSDSHEYRSAMMQASASAANALYKSKSRKEDMHFSQVGVFSEATHNLTQQDRIIGGLRIDFHEAEDKRPNRYSPATIPTNTTLNEKDEQTLPSLFVRYERDFNMGTYYVGVGHSQRFPDYWERLETDPNVGGSVFMNVNPEKTTQLDTGVVWNSGSWSGSLSGYLGKINDYILIRWSPSPTLTRNIDATVFGMEGDLTYEVTKNFNITGTLSYVYGENTTDDKPLAQQPPLEFRLAANYDNTVFFFGALLRLVASQDRYDVGSGSIVMGGMDIGESDGFCVFSVNGGWRPTKNIMLTIGVDNLFDETYSEYLSKSATPLAGYLLPSDTRINEPGRTLWAKLNFEF